MNTRLSQDAADTLEAYEQQQRIRERAKADWARAQPTKLGESWKPVQTDEQRKQHELDVIEFNLPF